MDSLACSYSARFDAPGVFACIPDWCTAPPDLNGAQLPVAVSDWQWLAPEQTGEAGVLEFARAPSQSLSEKRYLRPLRDRQIRSCGGCRVRHWLTVGLDRSVAFRSL